MGFERSDWSVLEASQNRYFLIDKLVENERVWGLSAPDGLWDARLTDHARPLPQPVAGDLPQPYVFLRKIAKPAPRCQANARFSRMGLQSCQDHWPVARVMAYAFLRENAMSASKAPQTCNFTLDVVQITQDGWPVAREHLAPTSPDADQPAVEHLCRRLG